MDGNTAAAALDIAGLRLVGTAGTEHFTFATPQSAYDVLSYDLPRNLLAVVKQETGDETHLRCAAFGALFDIYLDLLRLGRALIDLCHLQTTGRRPLFDPRISPIFAHLADPDAPAVRSVADIYPHGHGALVSRLSPKNRLRALKRDVAILATARSERYDVLAHSPLIDQYLSSTASRAVDVNPYLFSWPEPSAPAVPVEALVQALGAAFDRHLEPCSHVMPAAAAKAATAARVFATAWLNLSDSNLHFLARYPLRCALAGTLVGGAPKMLGRLVGHFYQQNGHHVVRCAHGGERAFFDDDHWGLSELPFCNTYITHGVGEAEAIVRRHATDRIIRVHDQAPTCISFGSARHQTIFAKAHEPSQCRTARAGSGRVMVLASSFLGEGAAHVPAVKPTDVHLADLQIWLMHQLRAHGYRVLFKPHPKTMIDAPDLFAGAYDELVVEPFDPIAHNVDVFVFDYAGSAFFDALASDRGVVLVDTRVRPFDATTFDTLRTRCEIVAAPTDEANRFRPDPATLFAAIDRAAQVGECPAVFAQRYFNAPGLV